MGRWRCPISPSVGHRRMRRAIDDQRCQSVEFFAMVLQFNLECFRYEPSIVDRIAIELIKILEGFFAYPKR
jgi:hypothetical protein